MYSIGCDPELFLRDKIDGQLRASCGLFGGSKEKPLAFGEVAGFALQEDNVALEFNIPPANDKHTFNSSLSLALKELENRADKLGLKLAFEASAIFPADQLTSEKALVFGCDPDYNAWLMDWNPRPFSDNPLLRSCGGHVHIGCQEFDVEQKMQVIRWMDILLGIPSIGYDKDRQRRELYGKPGAMRFKEYGVEYRTLSNFWVKERRFRDWVFEQSQVACDRVLKEHFLDDAIGDDVTEIITTGNLEKGMKFLRKFQ